MQYLLDTGILLRLLNRQADLHEPVRHAVRRLKQQQHICVYTLQNLCEFWNVCTRPQTSRGGLGLTIEETDRRVRVIERVATLLPDVPQIAGHWRLLAVAHHVIGVQVHDTRLVAAMFAHGVTHLLTLNPTDFRRFNTLIVSTPDQVLAQ